MPRAGRLMPRFPRVMWVAAALQLVKGDVSGPLLPRERLCMIIMSTTAPATLSILTHTHPTQQRTATSVRTTAKRGFLWRRLRMETSSLTTLVVETGAIDRSHPINDKSV